MAVENDHGQTIAKARTPTPSASGVDTSSMSRTSPLPDIPLVLVGAMECLIGYADVRAGDVVPAVHAQVGVRVVDADGTTPDARAVKVAVDVARVATRQNSDGRDNVVPSTGDIVALVRINGEELTVVEVVVLARLKLDGSQRGEVAIGRAIINLGGEKRGFGGRSGKNSASQDGYCKDESGDGEHVG